MQHIGPFFVDESADGINIGIPSGEDVVLSAREARRIAEVLESAGTVTIRNIQVQAGLDAEIRIGRYSHHLQRMLVAQLARALRSQGGSAS
ncbi:MAG TPA: hypothetical protein VMV15_06590 [Candidatus Binataceae bacterium]|nr:hypothetical protein [Candidatus Binataceae bacterium]